RLGAEEAAPGLEASRTRAVHVVAHNQGDDAFDEEVTDGGDVSPSLRFCEPGIDRLEVRAPEPAMEHLGREQEPPADRELPAELARALPHGALRGEERGARLAEASRVQRHDAQHHLRVEATLLARMVGEEGPDLPDEQIDVALRASSSRAGR